MNKLMFTLVALLAVAVGNAADANASMTASSVNVHKARLMEMPPFDRACVLIRHFETLHKPKHWPTIGFGHVVTKGENYTKRQYSSLEAERIMRKDLSHLCAYYRSYGTDSLLLAVLAYNVGSGRVNGSNVIKKLRQGDRSIHADYTAFCKYQGRRHPGLYRRRWLELELFYQP